MEKRYTLARYTTGAVAARTGDEMSGPALLLAGLAATGSATAASAVLAGLTVSAAVGGPVFGVLLDRSPRPGRLLACTLTLYAMALGALLLSLGRVPVACTVLIAAAGGLLGPALSGGWTSQLPRVAASGALPRANAVDAMTFNLASLAGPALAAAAAASAGAPSGVAGSAALICLALPAARALPERSVTEGTAARRRVHTDLTAGFLAIARSPTLARATTASVVSCVGSGALLACTPLLGERVLGGADRGAALLSVAAAAALAANTLLSRRPGLLRPDTVVRLSTLVLAAAPALAATGRPVPVAASAVLTGIGEGPQLTALFAIRHREAPARLRGQIFTTGASLKLTGFAIGAAIAGPLATWSPPGALLAAAGVQLLAAASSF
ncbi:MFS transporter [Streptomyces sp. NBC_01306]|uniref:MFS transporter n=1 Tax=Streptomyces sp. NBC_01306 TaxID=2903819 RepID=UPI00224D77C0|nr:MFS transporter [Streptomyces sp. NBC_01306]MCX4723525.1 MFS transporter [Streptomyces sp. NBC_01306]